MGYIIQRPLLFNANLARMVNSKRFRFEVRPKQRNAQLHDRQKRNPLTDQGKMKFLYLFDKERRAAEKQAHADNKANRATRFQQKKVTRKFIGAYNKQLQVANKKYEQEYK
jgi:hypothetical protein